MAIIKTLYIQFLTNFIFTIFINIVLRLYYRVYVVGQVDATLHGAPTTLYKKRPDSVTMTIESSRNTYAYNNH